MSTISCIIIVYLASSIKRFIFAPTSNNKIFFVIAAAADDVVNNDAANQQKQQMEINTDGSSSTLKSKTTTTTNSDKKIAIVTLVTTSLYVPGAEVLAQSLHSVHKNTSTSYPHDLVILYIPPEQDDRSDLTTQNLQDLKTAGWNLHPLSIQEKTYNGKGCPITPKVAEIMNSNPQTSEMKRYWGTCAKLSLWSLIDYDVVIYIDADGIVLNPITHLIDWFLEKSKDDAKKIAAQVAPSNDGFQTAFLILHPSTMIHNVLQRTLSRVENLAEGDLPLLNQIFGGKDKDFLVPLPDWTSVAQSNDKRPFKYIQNEDEEKKMKKVVNWDQILTYDFAGPPNCKPWVVYAHQKLTRDKYQHSCLGKVRKGSHNEAVYLKPQWVWNDYYDEVLKRKEGERRK